MASTYSVRIQRAALKELRSLPKEEAAAVGRRIDDLATDPRPRDIKKLRGDLGYRVRVGSYRILYQIDDSAQTVTVYRIRHRRDAYR